MKHILGVGCDRWGTLYRQTHGDINDQQGEIKIPREQQKTKPKHFRRGGSDKYKIKLFLFTNTFCKYLGANDVYRGKGSRHFRWKLHCTGLLKCQLVIIGLVIFSPSPTMYKPWFPASHQMMANMTEIAKCYLK